MQSSFGVVSVYTLQLVRVTSEINDIVAHWWNLIIDPRTDSRINWADSAVWRVDTAARLNCVMRRRIHSGVDGSNSVVVRVAIVVRREDAIRWKDANRSSSGQNVRVRTRRECKRIFRR